MIGLVVVGLLLSAVLAYAAAPYLTARLDDRHMTPTEREQLAWGGLGIALALFLLAVLIIGVHQ